MKIGIIGGGMASSTLLRYIQQYVNYVSMDNVFVFDEHRVASMVMPTEYPGIHIVEKSVKFVKNCDIVFISSYVQDLHRWLIEVKKEINRDAIICSILPGMTIAVLKKYFPSNPVVRTIINFPIVHKKGIIVFSSSENIDVVAPFVTILKVGGEVMQIDEDKMNTISSVIYGGTVFFHAFFDELASIISDIGVDKDKAKGIVLQIAEGDINQARENSDYQRLIKNLIVYEFDEVAEAAYTTFERDHEAKHALRRQFEQYAQLMEARSAALLNAADQLQP